MARQPRLAIAGQPHLVIQRGHPDRPAFVDDADRHRYLASLQHAARACAVAVHAYVLMDAEIRLLVTPSHADALGRFMQRVGRLYVPAFNRRHGAQGPLWTGRFHAAVVDPETHAMPAIRFIEQAPVRAGIAARADAWPWSSAAHHLGRASSPLLTEHPARWRLGNTPFEREARHQLELQRMLSDAEVDQFLGAARGGWLLGTPAFAAALRKVAHRPVQPAPRGRPRRLAV